MASEVPMDIHTIDNINSFHTPCDVKEERKNRSNDIYMGYMC